MKKYRIIYADPPWSYGGYIDKTCYQVMSLEEIKKLPVKELADGNAILFLWATSFRLPWAIEVMKAWGFKYKTSLIWDKVVPAGTSNYYARPQHELLLIGGQGSAIPDRFPKIQGSTCGPDTMTPSSIIRIQKGKHSEKPEWFADYIDSNWPLGDRIELFARRAREGWDVWGNEAPNSIDWWPKI